MDLFNILLLVFIGIVASPVVAWLYIDELKKELSDVKNETTHLESDNHNLTSLINDHRSIFKQEMEGLNELHSYMDKALNDTMIKLAELRVQLAPLWASKRLLQRIVSYDKLVLFAIYFGQKWIHEGNVLLLKGRDDSDMCHVLRNKLVGEARRFQMDYEIVDDDEEEEETIDVRAWNTPKREEEQDDAPHEAEILKLELKQAKTELKSAQRQNVELKKLFTLERHYQLRMKNEQVLTLNEIADNSQDAEESLKSFEEEVEILTKEVSELMEEHQALDKRMEELYAKDPKVRRYIFKRVHTDMQCFLQFMAIAANGFDYNILFKPLLL